MEAKSVRVNLVFEKTQISSVTDVLKVGEPELSEEEINCQNSLRFLAKKGELKVGDTIFLIRDPNDRLVLSQMLLLASESSGALHVFFYNVNNRNRSSMELLAAGRFIISLLGSLAR